MSTQASVLPKIENADLREFAGDVRWGLSQPVQKELHSKYLYDELGSALFDAITFLPEYGLTRADARLLRTHAADIAESIPGPIRVVELGSGSGTKTRYILQAVRQRQAHVAYHPIDVSPAALSRCVRELADVAAVLPSRNSYLDGLTDAVHRRRPGETLLVLFLGSTIGNFERPSARAFLSDLQKRLQPGDALLVGADLEKSPELMVTAYDDPAGVTAAFNLNLLGRVNRELGANFNLRAFRHVARYNEEERRIEMHLLSLKDQTVSIPSAEFTACFAAGETIWTESSHKFSQDDLPRMAGHAGFRVCDQWVDQEWPFVESLWRVAGTDSFAPDQPSRC
jgi:dimethylhistidine N-methyltransferase